MGKAVREGHLSIEEGNTMIVFDSSTLILLAKKELLDMFLHNFNGVVAIPKEVTKESCTKKTLDALLIEKRIENGEIKVYEIEKRELVKKLIEDFSLEIGEAEAIVLCVETGSKILATDDKNAMNACKVLRIRFTTAINVLIRMYEKRLIGKEKALMKLDNLKKVGRYKRDIIEDAKRRVVEWEV